MEWNKNPVFVTGSGYSGGGDGEGVTDQGDGGVRPGMTFGAPVDIQKRYNFQDIASPSPSKGGWSNPTYQRTGGTPERERATATPPAASWLYEGEENAQNDEYMGEYGMQTAAAAMGSDRPEEERFEQVVRKMVTQEMSVADGLKAFREICCLRGHDLRDLADNQIQETPQYHVLVKDAEELESEGATWNLLWYLFAIDDASFPAGKGGDFVHGAGFVKTMRQHATDLVFQDAVLNRAARVVAWLEAERKRQDPEPGQGFGRKDGVWKETKSMLDGGAGESGACTRLDPDVAVRELSRINIDNEKDEERLCKALWRFLRSGRMQQAAELCQHVGQPWRAASLTGYAMHGPLPLGDAADEADSYETGIRQSEILAGEIESGARSKLLWRWACHAAARRISESNATFEAALYGVLAGDIKMASPACSSWEDLLWLNIRTWLEYQVDLDLIQKSKDAINALHGEREPDQTGILSEGDLDTSAMQAMGISCPGNDWPIESISKQMPENLEGAVMEGAAGFGGTEIGSVDRTKRFRKIQVELMLGKLENLLESLIHWIVPGGATEEAQSCPPGLMRFSAHLALLLWSMDLVEVGGEHGSPLYTKLNDGLQKLVWIYTVHLIDSASYSLVPTYLVHLRLGLRRTTTHLLLEQSTFYEPIAIRKKINIICRQWFQKYIGVDGFADDEMLVSVVKFCDKARETSFGGPLARAESLSWMFFDPEYSVEAFTRSVLLCQEFSLGGLHGALAGLHLLKEVIPSAADSSCLGDLISRSDEYNLQSLMRELASWERYFEILREYLMWEQVYGAAVEQVLANHEDEDAQQDLLSLSDDTQALFNGIIEFILVEGAGWMSSLPDDAHEAILILTPSGLLSANEAEMGSAYPAFSEEETQVVCKGIDKMLTKALDSSGISHESGPAEGLDIPGQVFVKMWSDGLIERELFDKTVIEQFTTILKEGVVVETDVDDKERRVQVLASNLSCSSLISCQLCRAICLPRLVLFVACIREALAYMGTSTSSMQNADTILKKASQGWDGLLTEAEVDDINSRVESSAKLSAQSNEM